MVADLVEPAKPRLKRYTQADHDRVHADAILIGVRPAARKHHVNEDTACGWAYREKWKLPACLPTLPANQGRHLHDPQSATQARLRALDQLSESIDEHGEHSRLYLSAATLQAAHELAANGGRSEGERVPYAGLLNTSRAGDTVHGWQAQRQAGAQTNVAVQVVLPTPDEEAKRDALHAKLDEITRRLAERSAMRSIAP